MNVAGEDLSPVQYTWLFGDLASMDDEQAKLHWNEFGSAEVKSFARWPDQSRLARIKLQQFSQYPGATPSEFAFFQPCHGHSKLLNIVFSHANVPQGHFGLSQISTTTAGHVIFFNTVGNDWYQHGIPDFCTSIEMVVATIRSFAAYLCVDTIRTVGISMGGYASILFGHLLNADRVVSVAPELSIGALGQRSWDMNLDRRYREDIRDLGPILDTLGSRAEVITPARDAIDVGSLGDRFGQVLFADANHGETGYIRWEDYFNNPYSDSILDYLDPSVLCEPPILP